MLNILYRLSDIDYFAPFPALSESISTHITYLDTIGRPKITLKYRDLTDKHTGTIYVRTKYALSLLPFHILTI